MEEKLKSEVTDSCRRILCYVAITSNIQIMTGSENQFILDHIATYQILSWLILFLHKNPVLHQTKDGKHNLLI
jgi:hypothetical protein